MFVFAAEFELSDITSIKVKFGASAAEESICSDDYATKVLQRYFKVIFYYLSGMVMFFTLRIFLCKHKDFKLDNHARDPAQLGKILSF